MLAPNAKLRDQVIALGREQGGVEESPPGQLDTQSVAGSSDGAAPGRRTSSRWAALIARIYDVLPLVCPSCGGSMSIIAFVTDRAPPQGTLVVSLFPFALSSLISISQPDPLHCLRLGRRPRAPSRSIRRAASTPPSPNLFLTSTSISPCPTESTLPRPCPCALRVHPCSRGPTAAHLGMLAKVPHRLRKRVAREVAAVFRAPGLAESKKRLAEITARWHKELPEAVNVLERGFTAATQFYAFPEPHWARLRTTNSLERLHTEIKRRIRSAGAFPDRASALRLITAVALRTTAVWSERRYLDLTLLEPKEVAKAA